MSMNMDSKNFQAIVFPKQKNYAVVPRTWIIKEEKKCAWPDVGCPEELSRNQSIPLKSWHKVKCKIIRHASAGSYDKCLKRLTWEDSSSESEVEYISTQEENFAQNSVIAPLPQSPNRETECTCKEDLKTIKNILLELKVKLGNLETSVNLLAYDNELVGSSRLSPPPIPIIPPARSIEELQCLIKEPHIIRTLSNLEVSNLHDTVRKILQRMLSRDLAIEFSFSGLGQYRRNEKNRFKDSEAYNVLLRSIRNTRFCHLPTVEIDKHIMVILRRSKDWAGGQRKRSKKTRVSLSPDGSKKTPSSPEAMACSYDMETSQTLQPTK